MLKITGLKMFEDIFYITFKIILFYHLYISKYLNYRVKCQMEVFDDSILDVKFDCIIQGIESN